MVKLFNSNKHVTFSNEDPRMDEFYSDDEKEIFGRRTSQITFLPSEKSVHYQARNKISSSIKSAFKNVPLPERRYKNANNIQKFFSRLGSKKFKNTESSDDYDSDNEQEAIKAIKPNYKTNEYSDNPFKTDNTLGLNEHMHPHVVNKEQEIRRKEKSHSRQKINSNQRRRQNKENTMDEFAICLAVILRDHKISDEERKFRTDLSAMVFKLAGVFDWSKTLEFHDKMITLFQCKIVKTAKDVKDLLHLHFPILGSEWNQNFLSCHGDNVDCLDDSRKTIFSPKRHPTAHSNPQNKTCNLCKESQYTATSSRNLHWCEIPHVLPLTIM